MSSKAASANALLVESEAFAEEVGLRYVHDRDKGFTRLKKGKGFVYLDHANDRITHDGTLHRIQSLVIPPAWEGVWICRFGNGHLQATGRDVKTRKQYRYHSLWNQGRNETKFQKLSTFGHALPGLRDRVHKDLQAGGMGREKILAAIIEIMEKTMIRVGNDYYAEENDSYGLTTLLNKHTEVHGSNIRFKFKGKSGVQTDLRINDKKLGKIVRQCQELPGQELFAYEDDEGLIHDIESGDVNSYLREITQEPITAKTFRTWGATVKAAELLHALGPIEKDTQTELKRRQLEVVKGAAAYLCNTVSVCRKYYIHPIIFEADQNGLLEKTFAKFAKSSAGTAKKYKNLSESECAVLEILERI